MKFIILIFWSLWYVNFASRSVVAPILPVIEDELSISHIVAGSLFLFRSIGFAAILLLAGFVSSRLGLKRSILAGNCVLIVALILVLYSKTYLFLAFALFLLGLGAGIYLPCAIPLITLIFQKGNWGKAIAFHETAASFSLFSIPLLTAFALHFYQWRSFFAILAVACLLVTALFWTVAPEHRSETEKSSSLSGVLVLKNFWIISLLWTFASMAHGGIYAIIPLFLVTERGMDLEFANSVLGISRIGGLFSTLLVGFILDRFKIRRILFFIFLGTGLATIGVALAKSFWLLTAMLLLQETFSFAFFPAALTAIARLTDPEQRSAFTGATMAIAVIFGLGFSPVILGAVADNFNFQTGIFSLGLCITIACLSFRWLNDF